MKFFRDLNPIWQFLSALSGVLVLVITLLTVDELNLPGWLNWRFVGLVAILLLVLYGFKLMWKWIVIRIRWVIDWLKMYWRQILAIFAFMAICLLIWLIFGDLRVIGLVTAYTALLAFAFRLRLWPQPHPLPFKQAGIYSFLKIPLDQIANSSLEEHYLNLPEVDEEFDEIPFLLKPGFRGILDTKNLHDKDSVSIKLEKPVNKVVSVYVLINAGNALMQFKDEKIGAIELAFENDDDIQDIKSYIQETELDLGKNIREWAPGNIPGGLVDTTTDQLYQPFWRGKNKSGKLAVIDRLEIRVEKENRQRWLKQIKISRFSNPFDEVPADCELLVFAITLKGYF